MNNYSPGGIYGYNIEQTQAPGGFAPALAPMLLGGRLENRAQEALIQRGFLGGRGFRDYLGSSLSGEAGDVALAYMKKGGPAPKAGLEKLYRGWLKAMNKGKITNLAKGTKLTQGLRYGGTNLISDAFTLPIRITQNILRQQKLRPVAAREGQRLARNNPFISRYIGAGSGSTSSTSTPAASSGSAGMVRGASYDGGQMNNKNEKTAASFGGALGGIGTSVAGSIVAGLAIQHAASAMNKHKRESSIGTNWDKLVRKYPEFNKADPAERDNVQDIFEGLHAMSPEITDVPVLAAPLLRNAIEYGMQGFSPADMKTLTDINSKMTPETDPGHKLIPKPSFGAFGSLPEAGND